MAKNYTFKEAVEIIAKGTPEQISKNKRSYTGKYLKEILEKGVRE